MTPEEIAAYLEDHIKKSIENDILPLVKSSKVSEAGGLFAAPRLVFAYVDYLGYLYKGSSTSANAVCFLRDYFGRVDPRYLQVGGLIYHIYRHGTIHEYEPKGVELGDGTRVAWFVIKGGSKEVHFSSHFEKGILWLRIYLDSLLDDLNSAIDLYIQDIKIGKASIKNFTKARREIEEPEKENEVRRRNYICDSDFTFIRDLADRTKMSGPPATGTH